MNREEYSDHIDLKFVIYCPHCGARSESNLSIHPMEFPSGQMSEKCTNCYNLYVVNWSFRAEMDIFKCDREKAKTASTVEIDTDIADPEDFPEEDEGVEA